MNFQANAAEHWKGEAMRDGLQALWPAHTEVQDLRPFKLEVRMQAGEMPQQRMQFAVEGLLFRSRTEPTVYHARRDGFALSWLKPYSEWEQFQASALAGWEQFARVLQPSALHAVAVRFVNRLEFPSADFKLSEHFTVAPKSPPDLGWRFHGFVQQNVYSVPDSDCTVKVTLTPAFGATAAEVQAFILDIEVTLKHPLSETNRKIEEVLAEMRQLKNAAFFGMLTPRVVELYR